MSENGFESLALSSLSSNMRKVVVSPVRMFRNLCSNRSGLVFPGGAPVCGTMSKMLLDNGTEITLETNVSQLGP